MPLETEHDSIFFKYPLNYGITNTPSKVSDNDYNTYYTPTSAIIQTIGSANVNYTHIFIKCQNVASIVSNPSNLLGSDFISIEKNISVRNFEGTSIPLSVRGYQHFLIDVRDADIDPKQRRSGTSVSLTFTSMTNLTMRIHEIIILDEILRLGANSEYTKIEYDRLDRGGLIQSDLASNLTKAPAINNTRWKWNVNYGAIFGHDPDRFDRDKYEELLDFMEKYPNFTFACEYTRHPDRVFPALFPDLNVQLRFLNRYKNTNNAFFRISES